MTMDPFVRSLTGAADQPVLRLERRLAASSQDVWSAITDPRRLARWLGTLETTEAAGHFHLRVVDEPETPADLHVTRCAAPESLELSWRWEGERPSSVSVSIADDEGQTLLVLEHRLGEPQHAVEYGGGWEYHLTSLAALFGETRPFVHTDAAASGRWPRMTAGALTLQVELDADRAPVWHALTTVHGLRRWWWNQWSDVEIIADARPGGRYRFAAPRAGIAAEGDYIDVTPEEHVSFTWRWIDAEGTSTDEACDIRLTELPGGCRLTLRHTGPWADASSAESYRQGWESVFSALSRAVGSSGSTPEMRDQAAAPLPE